MKKNTFGFKFILIALVFALIVSMFSGCSEKKSTTVQGTDTGYGIARDISNTTDGIGRETKTTEETAPPKERNGIIVCVDPGHGFVDGGCGEGYLGEYLEKDITLQVALKLKDELIKNGFEVVLTHDGTTIPEGGDSNFNNIFSATERAVYVNTLDIDYFISIHVNAFGDDDSVSGMQLYYEQNYNKVNDWSKPIAESISASIISHEVDTKSVQLIDYNTLAVTRETHVAASLLEIGYCTNPTDNENMLSESWQNNLAKAVADGIYDFFKDKIQAK